MQEVTAASRTKRVAIVQSNYVPWKGYFDLVSLVDELVLYDDRQYTRRDWRNRNRIKTPQGTTWLTIPVVVKGRYHQRIDETVVSAADWAEHHWQILEQTYRRAACFDEVEARIRTMYEAVSGEPRLSVVNRSFTQGICDFLGIQTRLRWSTDYQAEGTKTERLVSLCLAAGARTYLSGPSARAYLDEDAFAEVGIDVEYMDYTGYPEYPQLFPPFVHEVTVLDLLFNVGHDAPSYMKHIA